MTKPSKARSAFATGLQVGKAVSRQDITKEEFIDILDAWTLALYNEWLDRWDKKHPAADKELPRGL